MAHEAQFLSVVITTSRTFLECLDKLPIAGDLPGNRRKQHPSYPLGEAYSGMFESAKALVLALRPILHPAESGWSGDDAAPRETSRAFRRILHATYGLGYHLSTKSHNSERYTGWELRNSLLHKCRLTGIVDRAIPESMTPMPAVDPEHIERLQNAVIDIEKMIGKLPPNPTGDSEACVHGDDFATVLWYGIRHDFTPNQAKCVKLLIEAWKKGGLAVTGTTLRDTAEILTDRFDRVFWSSKRAEYHPAWGTMIVPAERGSYRLAEPDKSPVAQKCTQE